MDSFCCVFSSAGGHRGPRGAVANEDLLWDACKRTSQTGYLLFLLWFAFMVVHVCGVGAFCNFGVFVL